MNFWKRFLTAAAIGRSVGAGALLGVAAFSFSACSMLPETQPDLTRFYVLTPTANSSNPGEAAPAESGRILLRAINVPEFLRGKMMVVRVGNNQVRFTDEARWAEPLEAGLHRVLREDLGERGLRVVSRGSDEHDFEIAVHLRSCEGVAPTNAARLAAHIEIFKAGTGISLIKQDDFVTEVAGWDGKDYGALAAKLSEAAGALSERIIVLTRQAP